MATLSDIMELIDGIDEAKADLKTSIAGKGVTVPAAAKLADLSDLVDEIQTGVTPTGTKQITITQNGTTTEDVTNYASAQITANVPNTYAAADEGKVVSNGALVSQTSDTVTQNGTVDTTLIDSLTVNVSGGGGGSTNLIASGTYTGDGTFTCTVPIGTKAAETDFVFEMYVAGGTEFSYDAYYKIACLMVTVPHEHASYDLSTNGSKKPTYTGSWDYTVNNDGTISNVAARQLCYYKSVRNATMFSGLPQADRPEIVKSDTGFSVYYTQGNSNYKFVSGMTYYWKLYYFGDNPSTDIVEVT